ncbi:hypothetical protein CO038_02950 [Candidatus Pacearchaeota archaeon CG_4_9_14_0_2_um_filter_39_13]|nr:NAD-dependent epimerase/dehydratase family protein [Candidatus Pacearchaeota archaeon]OIO42173.1 MAG: hypothetical protein AUJ64_04355 [Candidatus Pacearchaeota archaeon CG1_02_39_14]PJC44525.1 MAG: hypothetical protein CO038_02950 [Candidatus Pacearchaeota archaeon CG_4_9_14_0_2_um_filter_39_13]
MKYDFIVFGGTGQQGKICSRDLLESGYSVMIAGRNKNAVKKLLKNKKTGFTHINLSDNEEIINAITNSGAEVVVNCAELVFNVPIMRACLKTKKSLTDLGGLQYVTKEQFKLNKDFKNSNILCLTGCGSTPGLLNVVVKHAIENFDKINTIELGFAWDSNIKKFVIPYSMHSIFDEFTQHPVTYHNGKFLKEDRIVCKGTKDFKEVGKQTVYCIVHSEVYSFAKYFRKYGLKNVHYMAGFPEHSAKVIQLLLDLGFSLDKEIEVDGVKFRIVDFTDKVLGRLNIPKGYRETENLWAEINGTKNGKTKKMKVDCIIKTVKGWEDAGSNIDTGRTISIMSQMIKNDLIKEKGVFAPEAVIPHKLFIKELGKREMYVYLDNKRIN